ncbi:MAG: hypothetical protein U0132_06025 [Gemmatimonadaceae bacterium]
MTHTEHTSRAARNLADVVVAEVSRFRREHPKTTNTDIRTGLALATQRLVRDAGQAGQIRAMVLAAIALALAGLVAVATNTRTRGPLQQAPWMLVVAVVVVVAAGVVFAAARSRDQAP